MSEQRYLWVRRNLGMYLLILALLRLRDG